MTHTSSSPDRLSVPDSIVIPAGADNVRVPVVLSDDAEYGDDATVQVTASAEGFASADRSIEIINDDLPTTLTLQRDGVNHLVGSEFDVVIDEYGDDAEIDLLFSNASQQFTLSPVDAASVNVKMSGGSDSAWLHTKGFSQIDGGAGVDTAVIAPVDLDEGEAVDVASWLSDRVIGFETVVLGASDVADADDSLIFDLDLDALSQVNGGSLPVIVSTTGQTLRWIGEWRLGEMTMTDGKLSAAVTSGDLSVQVETDEAWRNFVLAQDVNASGLVTATDALVIINRLNADPSFELPDPQSTDDLTGVYYDVSGDGLVTALDALQVINWLNENDGVAPSSEPTVDLSAAELVAVSPVVTPAEQVELNVEREGVVEQIADVPGSANALSVDAAASGSTDEDAEAISVDLDAAANRIDPASVDVAMSELELLSTSDSLQSELQR
ncbi:MAG: dockerin type I domain-containing protein [Rhodopirellula sp. JB044]|uniref:dockerin type I domain-containing protein n=1 Tax=Rhodopirellula sp. JB044 TaxID=3342844 RepID=UPI00370B5D18